MISLVRAALAAGTWDAHAARWDILRRNVYGGASRPLPPLGVYAEDVRMMVFGFLEYSLSRGAGENEITLVVDLQRAARNEAITVERQRACERAKQWRARLKSASRAGAGVAHGLAKWQLPPAAVAEPARTRWKMHCIYIYMITHVCTCICVKK